VGEAVEPPAGAWLRRLRARELCSRELAERCLRRPAQPNAVAAVAAVEASGGYAVLTHPLLPTLP
jgi:hypothetical protein